MDEALWLQRGLLIPYALRLPLEVDGERRTRLRPDAAAKGETYYCPECGQALHLHGGGRRRRHFRHDEYVRPCAFREDGADRVLARHAVFDAVLTSLERPADPEAWVWWVRTCPACGRYETEQPLPAEVASAALKRPVPLASTETVRSADVALLDAHGQNVCLVEIHRDREAPAFRFRDQSVYAWVLLAARPTLAEPQRWRVEQAGNLPPLQCPQCARAPLAWRPDDFRSVAARRRRAPVPDAVWQESRQTDLALIVNTETGVVLQRLSVPDAQARAHCHGLNRRAGRALYVAVRAGRAL